MLKGNMTIPRIYPWGTRDPEQIDRATEVAGNITLKQEKLYEVGRRLKLGVHKLNPDTPITINQGEYLSMSFWRALAGISDPATGQDADINLDDLANTMFDLSAAYIDETEVFKGTVHFPKMRLSGFSINIGSPEAKVERNFSFVGELCKLIVDNYLAYAEGVVSDTGGVIVLTLDGATGNPPEPLEDTIFRVLRVDTEGVVSEVTTYTWDTGGTLTVTGCEIDDIVKVFYPAADPYTDLWVDNDSVQAVYADQCEVYLRIGSGGAQKIYKLQSVKIDVALARTDEGEIGNTEKVQIGVKEKTVTVTLNRLLDDFSLEQLLADQTDPGDSKIIDVKNFVGTIGLVVKIYTDNTKQSFAMGIRVDNLSPTTLKPLSATPEAFNPADNALESDNFLVSPDIADLELGE